jgi:hypothetical protein
VRLYKFSELSEKAQNKAIQSYLDGWEETHDKGDMSWGDAKSSCLDCDEEIAYNKKGNDMGEFDCGENNAMDKYYND